MCLRQLSLHNYRMFSDLSITFPDMSDDRADGDCEGAVEVEGDRGADGRGNWVTVIGDAPEMVRISDFYQRQVREGKMIHLPLIAFYGTDRLWPRDRSKWATHSTAYLHTPDRRAHDGAVPTVPDSGPRRHGPAG